MHDFRISSTVDEALPLTQLRASDANLQFDIAHRLGALVPIGKVAALARLQGGKLYRRAGVCRGRRCPVAGPGDP